MSAVSVRVASACARVLTHLPPERLAAVMRRLCASAEPASHDEALAARTAVCDVSRRCAGQGCLQRSIAVVLICRLRGRAPGWRTGLRFEPFLAHAWVVVDGQPVGENAEVAGYQVVHAADLKH